MDPVIIVFLSSSGAALMAPLGAIPLIRSQQPPERWMAWANALAAGVMLGAAVVIAEAGLTYPPALGGSGAVLGIAFLYGMQAFAGAGELDLDRLDETPAVYGYKVLLAAMAHAGFEGIAIGVAMIESVPFGIVTAAAFAVHNIPEGTVLAAVLRVKGLRLDHATAFTVATNSGQVFLAVTTYALLDAIPALRPIGIGFAVGSLVFLVLFQVLPPSYRQAGSTSVALATSLAMGVVVLLTGWTS